MGSIVRMIENRGKYEHEKNILPSVKVDKNQHLRDNQSIGIKGLRD